MRQLKTTHIPASLAHSPKARVSSAHFCRASFCKALRNTSSLFFRSVIRESLACVDCVFTSPFPPTGPDPGAGCPLILVKARLCLDQDESAGAEASRILVIRLVLLYRHESLTVILHTHTHTHTQRQLDKRFPWAHSGTPPCCLDPDWRKTALEEGEEKATGFIGESGE